MRRRYLPLIKIVVLSLVAVAGVDAIEIPLERGTAFGGGTAQQSSIGYVDIEKLFAEHPMKKRLQDEFQAEVQKRKNEIVELDKSINDLTKVIVSSTTELNRAKLELEILKTQAGPQEAGAALTPGTTVQQQEGGAVAQSTAAVQQQQRKAPVIDPALLQGKEAAIRDRETGLDALQKELDKRKDTLAQRIGQNKGELEQLEEKNTAAVLADLYQVLQKAANDEGVTIVIDKNDVLYGQTARDLTDKVRERLQGR